jgi:hypothetical protein
MVRTVFSVGDKGPVPRASRGHVCTKLLLGCDLGLYVIGYVWPLDLVLYPSQRFCDGLHNHILNPFLVKLELEVRRGGHSCNLSYSGGRGGQIKV